MSTGALFGNTAARGSSKNLVELKAGKMTMKGKMVYPDNRKGQLLVLQSDDGLMHLCWKDRTNGLVEDDLIIFPDDCEFKHVSQCKTGRVYLLRFKSTNRKFFFWLQDLKTDKDEEQCRKINEVLNNPPAPVSQRGGGANPDGDLHNLLTNMSQQQLMQLFGGVGQISGLGSLLGTMNRPLGNSRITTATTPVTTTVARPPAAQTPAPTVTSEAPKNSSTTNGKSSSRTSAPFVSDAPAVENPILLSDLQNFLSGIPTPPGTEPVVPRNIANELTNVIPSAISASESLERAMNTYLPSGDNLCTTLSSPQFSQALSMFWSALQSGQAGPVVQQFGLGQDVVNAAASGNIEQFVSALETEAQGQSQAEAGAQSKDQAQPQAQPQTEDKTTKPPPDTGSTKKDNDDDDDMAMWP